MTELLSLCPNCRSRLKIPSGSRTKQVDCPKCKSGFVPQDAEIACPKCKTALPPGSVFCVGCGYDFRRKTTIASSTQVFVKAPKEKKREPEPDRFEPLEEELDRPSWKEILAIPFNFEFVVSEAIILTMWGFFWAGLFIAIAGGMMMAMMPMGIGMIFSACMLLAGIIRLWMFTSDISLQTVMTLLAGLLGLASLAGWIASLANPNLDPVGVGLFAFMFFVLFGVWMRCVSFYMGRYFGLVRRSALRATMSVSDRGGFVDLLHGVLISLVGMSPLLVIWMYDFYLAIQEKDFPGGFGVYVALLGIAMGWAYIYMPMAVATVALRGSVNPMLVFQWAFKSFADYMPLLVLYLPFHAIMWAVAGLIVRGVDQALNVAPAFGVFLAGLNFLIIQVLLNEYSICVTLASLALVMRRNETMLHWVKEAKRINAERD
jgi:uncharacterized Zn finger protein (UPF0148 family)